MAQCKAWRGPISAVVYVAVPQAAVGGTTTGGRPAYMDDIVGSLTRQHQGIDAEQGENYACQLDLLIAFEELASMDDAPWLYPYNVLRNYALMNARTRYVAQLDVDMLPSASLHAAAAATTPTSSTFAQSAWLQLAGLLDARHFVVVPALRVTRKAAKALPLLLHNNSTSLPVPAGSAAPATQASPDPRQQRQQHQKHQGGEAADAWASVSKAQLLQADAARPFARSVWHAATDYERWFGLGALGQGQGQGQLQGGYAIKYEPGYEPWGVMLRRAAPWWPCGFRGYGFDKVVYVASVNASGFGFWAHPDAFLLHRNHPSSSARTAYLDYGQSLRAGNTTREAGSGSSRQQVAGQGERAAAAGSSSSSTQADEVAWQQRRGRELFKRMARLAEEAVADMAAGRYTPLLDPATRACRAQLPWWQ